MKSWLTFVFACWLTLTGFAAEWQTLENCRLIPNPANDGDSFHAEHAGQEYIFRLYYVDTPETDLSFPERVAEQAEYFGVSSKRAVEIGHAAAQFTARALSGRFTVVTRWQNALGRSKLPRHYAVVMVGGQSLAELLVQNGLARVFGVMPAKTEQLKLLALEHQAKANHAGGWGGREMAAVAYRLFTPSGERHNARCPFFNAPNTRPCAADEGKACRVCGG
jgi:endonuclease YncB( thermonuclease family)